MASRNVTVPRRGGSFGFRCTCNNEWLSEMVPSFLFNGVVAKTCNNYLQRTKVAVFISNTLTCTDTGNFQSDIFGCNLETTENNESNVISYESTEMWRQSRATVDFWHRKPACTSTFVYKFIS